MKIITSVLIVIAIGLLAFNIYQLDFNNLTHDDNMIALIGSVAALIAIVILLIFRVSKKIEEKTNHFS